MIKVAVGGTFEYLHDGHKKLIEKAFSIANKGIVHIGLTSNEMAKLKMRRVEDYSIRKTNLLKYIESISIKGIQYSIIELNDAYGTTLTVDYDYIIVSPETYSFSLKINELRNNLGKKEIKILKIESVMAEDGIPISSTRISNREIDIHGKLINKSKL